MATVPPLTPGRRRVLSAGLLLAAVTGLTAASGGLGELAPWRSAAFPPPPADAATRPLAVAPVTTARGPHTFLMTHPDASPVRWDPCRPIRIAVRPDGAPPGGEELVREVLAEVGAAAGLALLVEGATAEGPSGSRAAHQPERYGDRWAPVLLAWSDPVEYPPLAGDTVGVAGPVAVDPPGSAPARYVSGTVVLEASWFADSLRHPLGRRRAAAVLKHELGHLVGLDHVADPMQLMSPVYQSVLDWAAGDVEGLAALGRGPCHRDT